MNPSEAGNPQSAQPTLQSLSAEVAAPHPGTAPFAAHWLTGCLKARNARVEAAKGWETSWTRRILIAAFTYIVIVLFFLAAGLPNPFVNPLVPTVGFLLSTLSLEAVRRRWGRGKIQL